MLYKALSDWSSKLSDRVNKTSCLPGNKHHILSFRKSRDFSFQRYEKKPIGCKQMSLNQKYLFIYILFTSQK